MSDLRIPDRHEMYWGYAEWLAHAERAIERGVPANVVWLAHEHNIRFHYRVMPVENFELGGEA